MNNPDFDLKTTMERDGGRCVRADGLAARIVATDARGPGYPLVVLTSASESGIEVVDRYSLEGELYIDGDEREKNLRTLKPEPKEHTLWLNHYYGGLTVVKRCRESADCDADPHRIARVRVTFKEGQFDE